LVACQHLLLPSAYLTCYARISLSYNRSHSAGTMTRGHHGRHPFSYPLTAPLCVPVLSHNHYSDLPPFLMPLRAVSTMTLTYAHTSTRCLTTRQRTTLPTAAWRVLRLSYCTFPGWFTTARQACLPTDPCCHLVVTTIPCHHQHANYRDTGRRVCARFITPHLAFMMRSRVTNAHGWPTETTLPVRCDCSTATAADSVRLPVLYCYCTPLYQRMELFRCRDCVRFVTVA